MKYSLYALTVIACLLISCGNGLPPQQESAKPVILFGIEGFFGFSGQFMNGVYLDNDGNRYRISWPDITFSISSNGFCSDSLASLVVSKGIAEAGVVPQESLSVMDSLLLQASLRTDSVRVFQGPDRSGISCFAFVPQSGTALRKAIILKETGSWDYHLVSEQAMRLASMIENYCGN